MRERSRKADPSTNEQRLCSIATVAQEGSILPNPFGRQRHQRDCRTFWRISELMLVTVGQQDQIACPQGDALGVDAKKASPRDDHVQTQPILHSEGQAPRPSSL